MITNFLRLHRPGAAEEEGVERQDGVFVLRFATIAAIQQSNNVIKI